MGLRLPESVWDRSRVDIDALVREAPGPSIEAALSRLPRGLGWADRIDIVCERPARYQPLGPGSPWSASHRSLAVLAEDPKSVLLDLAAYARLATSLRAGPDRDLADPSVHLVLAERAGLEVRLVERLAASAWLPELVQVGSGWRPAIAVAAGLRPSLQRAEGARAGEAWVRLASEMGTTSCPTFAADDSIALECISPYSSDLEPALLEWGRSQGWASDEPHAAAFFAAELWRQAPSLRAERRRAEATQGLRMLDFGALSVGVVDWSRRAVKRPGLEGEGVVAVVVGASGAAREAALGVWVEAGLGGGDLGMVCTAPGLDAAAPLGAIWTSRDGYALPAADDLSAAASYLEAALEPARQMECPDEGWVPTTVGRVRRAMVRGRWRTDARLLVVARGRDPQLADLDRDGWNAARTVLRALVDFEVQPASSRDNPDRNRPSRRRFRV